MNGNDLINTTVEAPRQRQMLLASLQSWDYWYCRPYPIHAFGPLQWPLDKGPIPTALPVSQLLISELANFTFRNNGYPKFSVAEDDAADELLQELLRQNNLASQYVSLTEANGNQGAIAVKYSIDPEHPFCPVRFNFLSVPQECRVWVDPHDMQRILMARIQYPYRDQVNGKWYYYREEWTDDFYVTYQPKYAGNAEIVGYAQLPGYTDSLGDQAGEDSTWEIDKIDDNPLGIIPITVIRNKYVKGNPLGEGDLWNLFRVIDRIALTMHGEDRASQMHSDPTAVSINARLENDASPQPGEVLQLVQNNPEGSDPDFKLLEVMGAARQYSYQAIQKWEEYLYHAAGVSKVDESAVGNKGNMTALAMQLLYSRTISTCDRKRALWGEGLSDFLRRVLVGLRNFGHDPRSAKIVDNLVVACEWPDYFAQTDADKSALTDRTIKQVSNGFLTQERATERVQTAEGMPKSEINTLLQELRDQRAAVEQLQIEATKLGDGIAEPGGVDELAEISSALGGDNNMLT